MEVKEASLRRLNRLILAALNGNLEEVKLYASEDNVNERCDIDDGLPATPLGMACKRGHTAVVDFLISCGADVNLKSEDSTPLHLACDNGYLNSVQTLLSSWANVEAKDWYDRTALQRACDAGHHDVVKTLLSNRADVNTVDVDGWTPLHACRTGTVARILLDYGANVNARDCDGLTPLSRMSVADDGDRISTLLDHGAGTGIICGVQHSGYDSTCTDTVLMCCYIMCHEKLFQKWLPCYEKHFIKSKLAGVPLHETETPDDPPVAGVDWNQSERDAFARQCQEELEALKAARIGDSDATFFSLLTRNISDLRGQRVEGYIHCHMSWDDVFREFPIYGIMIKCSYGTVRRFLLTDLCLDFFPLTHKLVLPECAELVLDYLPLQDLESLAAVVYVAQTERALQEAKNLERTKEKKDFVEMGRHGDTGSPR